MRIAVCDDEMIFCQDLQQKIEQYYQSMDILVSIFNNPKELLAYIENKTDYFQAVFLDIEMPQMDGMTLAGKLKQINEAIDILFLTSHIEQMEEGYEVNAFRFLTKPVQSDKLNRALKALEEKQKERRQILIKQDGETHLLQEKEIICIQAENVYLHIYTKEQKFLVREKIKNMEEQLSRQNFIRVHRSYIISLAAVTSYEKGKVWLKNGMQVPVSRKNDEVFQAGILAYMRRQAGC